MSEDKKNNGDQPFELESQFILRLPPTPAAALRAAVRSGVMNLEDRLAIQIENDMRHATVQFDKWTLPAKIYDLPTIIESSKTLDRKIFYKTADICQIMIAQEGDAVMTDEEVSPKKKEKDKDKRYMLPHGITAPLKNVRKRRFRKTLKKKYVDLPDVEKEVKRLLRTDTEALHVRYEVVNAEDEKAESKNDERGEFEGESFSLEERELSNSQAADVAEYDIFGEVLSSSEESGDDEDVNVVDVGQAARKLESIIEEQEKDGEESKGEKEEVDLAKSMQLDLSQENQYEQEYEHESDSMAVSHLESATAGENLGQLLKEQKTEEEKMALMEKLGELEHIISSLQAKRRAQELEVMNIENQALKQRFQNSIERLKQDEMEKQMEYDEIMSILQEG
ncbi:transcription initiation factor TFIID subunit 7-like [Argiope bruennichi]|uniref:Transcription initiation factor TFIID subunit like protein n=1 Tax=Argiope bruennichi TaxID=94029 RepID=A0A8T0EM12_ARGBR|nr:transcription initiation factor TFIID subunit 7-like [Argiope bruennichi]KAF8774464.1 Transcription initiation factor TFIID subunit like protein [Argiope bruennichi]